MSHTAVVITLILPVECFYWPSKLPLRPTSADDVARESKQKQFRDGEFIWIRDKAGEEEIRAAN